MFRRLSVTSSISTLALAWALSVWSLQTLAEPAGRVEFVVGDVVVADPEHRTRSAQKGTPLNEGDTLITNDGRAQVRFSDGGHFSLQPQTQFRVDEYRYSGSDDKDDHVFLSLLKGGLRTISGLIGKHNRPAYRMNTTVATIGIRGTEYVLDLNATLYGHVARGAIEVCNGSGCLSVAVGKAFFVPSPVVRPVLTQKRAALAPADRTVPAAYVSVKTDKSAGAKNLTSGTGSAVESTPVKTYSGDMQSRDFALSGPQTAMQSTDSTPDTHSVPTPSVEVTSQDTTNSSASNSSAGAQAGTQQAGAQSGSERGGGQAGSQETGGQTGDLQRVGQTGDQQSAVQVGQARSQQDGAQGVSQQAGGQASNQQQVGQTGNQQSAAQVGQAGSQQGGAQGVSQQAGGQASNQQQVGQTGNQQSAAQVGQAGSQQRGAQAANQTGNGSNNALANPVGNVVATVSDLLDPAKIKKPKKPKGN